MNKMIEIVKKHLEMYPLMQEEDIYKLIHQSFFGPAHYIDDVNWAKKYLLTEAESCQNEMPEIIEVGGGYYRYTLISDEKYLATLCEAFIKSANTFNENKDGFKDLVDTVAASLTNKELKKKFLNLAKELSTFDYPAISHSQIYRENYHPHYRVIYKDYVKDIILPKN